MMRFMLEGKANPMLATVQGLTPLMVAAGVGRERGAATEEERKGYLEALIGVVLAGVGIYGLMAFSVNQRTQEIGIRMAFGAQQSRILTLVIGQGLKMALIGVAIGLAGSFAVTQLMASLLVGVSPTDPATFILVALLLTCVALFASLLPARRAAQVEPMLALRTE